MVWRSPARAAAVDPRGAVLIYLGALVLPPFGSLFALAVLGGPHGPYAAHALRALRDQVWGGLAVVGVQLVAFCVAALCAAGLVGSPATVRVALVAADVAACAGILAATALAGPVRLLLARPRAAAAEPTWSPAPTARRPVVTAWSPALNARSAAPIGGPGPTAWGPLPPPPPAGLRRLPVRNTAPPRAVRARGAGARAVATPVLVEPPP